MRKRSGSASDPDARAACRRSLSTQLDRIHVQRPAHAARFAQGVERVDPGAQLLLESARRAPLQAALAARIDSLYALREARRVRWSLDVDPVELG
jgi:primosomal protein N' (replication factor Y)